MRQPIFEEQRKTVHQENSAIIHTMSTRKGEHAGMSNLDRERASMMKEHAAAIARERYESLYAGCGMTDDESKEEAQRMAVWDLQSQRLSGERFIGDLYDDGTIHYYVSPYTTGCERIIRARATDPYIFRVRD